MYAVRRRFCSVDAAKPVDMCTTSLHARDNFRTSPQRLRAASGTLVPELCFNAAPGVGSTLCTARTLGAMPFRRLPAGRIFTATRRIEGPDRTGP
jgi:hypothetical protein